MILRIPLSLILIICCLAGCLSGEFNEIAAQELSGLSKRDFYDSLQRIKQSADFPGAIAAYCASGSRPYVFSTGYADVENSIRMPPSARMLAGSVGKSFVAAVALSLVQEGRLSLDDPISSWLGKEPWFSRLPNEEGITLRMLLRHQSGLPEYVHSESFIRSLSAKISTIGPDAFLTGEEIIALILDHDPLFEAGKGYAYSDTNYILVGMIIEKVTGNTYYEELERRFLIPMRLSNTGAANRRRIKGLVPGYIKGRTPFNLPRKVMENGMLVYNPATEWTGGGLFSNPRDLVRWARALFEGEAMKGDYLGELLNAVPKDPKQQEKFGPDVRYGLGVTIRNTRFGPAYGHRGWTPGYLSVFEYYPSLKLAVALQINELGDHNMTAYVDALVAALVEGRGKNRGNP